MKTICVAAAIIFENGKCVIGRRKRGFLAGKWEFPGGKLEKGETAQECLRREFREEFQVEVSVGEIVGEKTHEYPDFTINLVGHRATIEHGNLRLIDHDKIAWVNVDEI